MHELAIAESIADVAFSEMEKLDLRAIDKIVIKVGMLTDVVPEALTFGFKAITADTGLAKTDLQIETVQAKGRCINCDLEFNVEEFIFICPSCKSPNIETIQGHELHIAYLEVDDGEQDGN